MALTARMRRLLNDYKQIDNDFKNHRNIVVAPIGTEPYEKYHITYYVDGIYLDSNNKINTLNTHEVEIILHSEYPTYKPLCKIFTPIWHPNFRDGQICIGDIWGAGESLSDIIIHIGDMIQYKSWNASSPLSADAARWALENKHMFPIDNINLNISHIENKNSNLDIAVDNDINENNIGSASVVGQVVNVANNETEYIDISDSENDIDFSSDDFVGVTYIPSAERMQQMSQQIRSGQNNKGYINLNVVFQKGIIWGLIGGIIGCIIAEIFSYSSSTDSLNVFASNILGHPFLAKAYASGLSYSSLADALKYDFYNNDTIMLQAMKQVLRVGTGFWSAILASMIGLFLGVGEGIYYGSKENAKKYGFYGMLISVIIGFISGYLAQTMYGSFINEASSKFNAAFIRGVGWSIMGIGIGAAIGLIKYDFKRFIYCLFGGALGGFLGGFVFNYIAEILPSGAGTASRFVGVALTGILIGAGVGLLEQFAKTAWLKVVRGEFEGKEFLVFNGVTSVGGTGRNSIVLFKDKLVAPHHFDINMERNKYILIDCGSPMGTIVNGRRVDRYMLSDGDTISVGNTMLVFNSK